MMCFRCTKIAIIVFYGFRLLLLFVCSTFFRFSVCHFCADAIDHTICCGHIYGRAFWSVRREIPQTLWSSVVSTSIFMVALNFAFFASDATAFRFGNRFDLPSREIYCALGWSEMTKLKPSSTLISCFVVSSFRPFS